MSEKAAREDSVQCVKDRLRVRKALVMKALLGSRAWRLDSSEK